LSPAKLAQLLPERVYEYRATGRSAWIQKTYARDFPCLLRRDPSPTKDEGESDREDPHPF
ncbi:MAG TPA: hypothetical protein VFP47_17710, partial [Pyrinomonadaceae bacterium]|nr:hypothetical protein [Pyrinomonadaceae bacterium]